MKDLDWIGSSKKDLKEFPDEVQDDLGFALHVAQEGGKHASAKPMKGFGSGVMEIIDRFNKDTYRAVYTVQYDDVVYVLHAFQKKSTTGIKTPQPDLDKIGKRLKAAEKKFEARMKGK